MPLAELVSRYVWELVIGVFVLLLGVLVAAVLLTRLAWRRRALLWQTVRRVFQAIARLPLMRWLSRRLTGRVSALGRRVTSIQFLEIYLLAGLFLSIGFIVFVGLSQEIFGTSRLATFDQELATALQAQLTPGRLRRLHLLTALGSGNFLTALGILTGLVLLLRKQKEVAIAWGLTLIGGGVLNGALKAIYQRVRPEYSTIGGWSFPSGHAMGSFVCYGMLAYLALVYLPRKYAIPLAASLLLLVMTIGLTRIYLGVHYFSDVIAGYSAAIVWLAVAISGTEIARLRRRGNGQPAVETPPPILS